MRVRDFCSPQVVLAEPAMSLREAALLMRDRHVGALVVVERKEGVARPVGILTDRDIVVAVVAVPGARPEGIRVADAMSTQPAVAREDEGLFEVVQRMSERAVRRLPVVAPDGALKGIVTLDDVLRIMSAELGQLAEGLRWGRMREGEKRAPR
ncbi:MAG: CBS domain-containing protein [Betaproteobacteria bacterium]|nr:CBS domain-containing protein [Betaproteobacteria bacterium]MDH4325252.1 CBS domain-containing protein [Betaproteobacteria bacterium]MDH5210672.1 CBS domain-containing protein [Betaproteobacteria bacterium]MDH5577049.1 CBS domain-containing protein [Betaproteobacteria bacterium]